jgi:hypothetical protein
MWAIKIPHLRSQYVDPPEHVAGSPALLDEVPPPLHIAFARNTFVTKKQKGSGQPYIEIRMKAQTFG